MELGDWILFENMGAYTLPVASPFNGFPVPKVHVVADESIWYENLRIIQYVLCISSLDLCSFFF